MTRHHAAVMAVAGFPVLVTIHCAMFFVLPFLVPLLTGAAIALYGVVLSAAVVRHLWSRRGGHQTLAVGLVAVTWIGWIFIPTQALALHVRFWLGQSRYEQVVAQVARGEHPHCLATGDCILAGKDAPYVVFPFPGFLSAWTGVVHVPEAGKAPDSERLKSVGSDSGCDPAPFAPHYYVCAFY